MKILLDENLDWRLRRDLPGHKVESVPSMGWAGLHNGELLAKAEKDFDVFITMDSNMTYQQNIARYEIPLIVLKAVSNRLADTRPLMPKVLAALPALQVGKMVVIE